MSSEFKTRSEVMRENAEIDAGYFQESKSAARAADERRFLDDAVIAAMQGLTTSEGWYEPLKELASQRGCVVCEVIADAARERREAFELFASDFSDEDFEAILTLLSGPEKARTALANAIAAGPSVSELVNAAAMEQIAKLLDKKRRTK